MSYFKIRSHAKINLALNVVGKLKSLHKIESIVSFLNLHDIIKIRKIISKNHNIRFIGQFSNKIKTKNTISELLKNIDKKRLLKNKFEIIIKKNIPSEAGLGGGSMNAASVLNYFIKKKLIKIKKKQIEQLSYSVGSDVILGLYSKNLVLKKNNLIKTMPSKNRFHTLIVKPNFGCSTKKIFSKLKEFSRSEFHLVSDKMLSTKFLKKRKNDLEKIVFN